MFHFHVLILYIFEIFLASVSAHYAPAGYLQQDSVCLILLPCHIISSIQSALYPRCVKVFDVSLQVRAHRAAVLSGVSEGQAAQRSASVPVRLQGQSAFLYLPFIFLGSMSGGDLI